MAVISIFSGSYCGGDEVAEGVASKLGYERIDEKVLDTVLSRYDVAREKLLRAMDSPPTLLNKFTHEREKNIAYIMAAFAELVRGDNVVYHGFAGHFLPKSMTHSLRTCLIASLEYRVAYAVKTASISEKEAMHRIHKEDEQRFRWTKDIFGHEPYDAGKYDMLLPMQSVSEEDAIKTICENAGKEALKTTPEANRAAEDFILATRVNIALATKGLDIKVTSSDGNIRIFINRYVTRLEHLEKQLVEIAMKVPGVKNANCSPGTRFVPPSLVRTPGIEMPTKVLLVDDEREFVHTLSERLQTRNLNSSVVYDGEEALSFVENEEPEVMVLDLKMPGIDGIEVLRRMKKDHPRVEVIILTGHGSEKEEKIAMELGAFAYLQKPVDINVLTETMKKAYQKIGKTESGSEDESD